MIKYQKVIFFLVLAFIFCVTSSGVAAEPDIDKMISQLGNDSFKLREEASKNLEEKMDLDIYVKLCETQKKSKDLEVIHRVERLIDICSVKPLMGSRINLNGYPKYPCIDYGMPWGYKLDGPWQEWGKWDFINYYRNKALKLGTPNELPNFLGDRKATELFVEERLKYSIQEAVKNFDNEKEIRRKIKNSMELIQKDIDMFIEEEKDHYKIRGERNLLEIQNGQFVK